MHKAYQLVAKTMAAAIDGGMLAQAPCRSVAPPKTRAGRRRIGLPRRVVDELALHLRAPGRPTDPVFRSPAGGRCG